MIELPKSADSDSDRLADWAELTVLLDKPHYLSKEDTTDVLLNSGLISAGDPSRDRQIAEDIADSIWTLLEDRSRQLADAYPFDVDSDSLRIGSGKSWRDWCAFTCLLIQDIGHWYSSVPTKFTPGSKFVNLFEDIVAKAEQGIFRGRSTVFPATGGNGWASNISGRVQQVADLFERSVGVLDELDPDDKDAGLDTAARLLICDEEPGTLIVLTQCATGANWIGKTGEPSIQMWTKLVTWKAPLVKAVPRSTVHPKTGGSRTIVNGQK